MEQINQKLSPWTEGMLDLHHINTGRGDAAFHIFPDGTTMLLDAGELDPTVVIGGIISSTLLTLVVLPALYRSVYSREPG